MHLKDVHFSKVLEDLNKNTKERYSFSIDPQVFSRFKEACGNVSLSAVIEKLMVLSIESLEQEKHKTTPSDTASLPVDDEKENA